MGAKKGTFMEFRDLHYLLAIAQAKSISKAAQGLFMSQSSLSQALRLMEDELGGNRSAPHPGRRIDDPAGTENTG